MGCLAADAPEFGVKAPAWCAFVRVDEPPRRHRPAHAVGDAGARAAGPDYASFAADSQQAFWDEEWLVTANSNRMGYRLAGVELVRERPAELLSHAVLPGTIQVPPAALLGPRDVREHRMRVACGRCERDARLRTLGRAERRGDRRAPELSRSGEFRPQGNAAAGQRIYAGVLYQLGALSAIAQAEGGRIAHVKPHGALATWPRDPLIADAVVSAIRDFDPSLAVFGREQRVRRPRGTRLAVECSPIAATARTRSCRATSPAR